MQTKKDKTTYIDMVKKNFKVNGMMCSHCKANVERALNGLDGVNSAEASVENKNIVVDYDESKVDAMAIKSAVEDAGYQFES